MTMGSAMRAMRGRDIELGWRGRAAFAVTCGACCAVPALIVVGAVSAGAVLGVGATVAAIAVVGVITHQVTSGRIVHTRAVLRLWLAALAIVIAVAGMLTAEPSLLMLAVTGLGAAALLALADARGVARDHCA